MSPVPVPSVAAGVRGSVMLRRTLARGVAACLVARPAPAVVLPAPVALAHATTNYDSSAGHALSCIFPTKDDATGADFNQYVGGQVAITGVGQNPPCAGEAVSWPASGGGTAGSAPLQVEIYTYCGNCVAVNIILSNPS